MINQNKKTGWLDYSKTTLLGVVLFVGFVVFETASNQVLLAEEEYIAPTFSVMEDRVSVQAKSALVFDIETGEVLFAKNENQELPIASITKLITATAVIENLDLSSKTTITESDTWGEGRAGKLEAGNEYTYNELLFPLLLESSNDAGVVFERVTKGEVVEFMNDLVGEAGVKKTSFFDASGLSEKNISTASDLALITTFLYEEYPQVFDITRLQQYIGTHTGWVNNNPVLSSSYLGGKHGYTIASNRTIVSLFLEEFTAEDRVLGYVVLGSSDIKSDINTLREFVEQSVKFE